MHSKHQRIKSLDILRLLIFRHYFVRSPRKRGARLQIAMPEFFWNIHTCLGLNSLYLTTRSSRFRAALSSTSYFGLGLLTAFLSLLVVAVHAQSWEQVGKIVSSDRKTSQHFSKSVALSGNYAIVGAHREDRDENGSNPLTHAGAAYIYERQVDGSWVEVQKIVASDRHAQDNFGTSVSIDGSVAVIGAYKRDETNSSNVFLNQVGAVYVFERDADGQWNEVQKLLAADMDSLNYFGKSVSVSGNYLLVGAAFRDTSDLSGVIPEAGAAYFFEKNNAGTWEQKQKVVALDFEAFSIFGWSVAIDGTYAVVGAYKEDKNSMGGQSIPDAGAAYVFERIGGSWIQVSKLTASDRSAFDWFGYQVAIHGHTLVIGAYQEDKDAAGNLSLSNAGSAYVFERNASGEWLETQKIVASDRAAEDWYGYALDVGEEYILVGARQEDEDATGGNTLEQSGSAYMYEKDDSGIWQEVQKITAMDRGMGDWFGFSVSIDDHRCIIGAFSDQENEVGTNPLDDAGSAYLFELEETTAVRETFPADHIVFYPNPSKGRFQFKGDRTKTLEPFFIYDVLGRFVCQIDGKNGELDLSNLADGVYFVRNGGALPVKVVKY